MSDLFFKFSFLKVLQLSAIILIVGNSWSHKKRCIYCINGFLRVLQSLRVTI